MLKWNGYTINKVDKEEAEDYFTGSYVYSIDEEIPKDIANLENGYYKIEEVNEYFMINGTSEYRNWRELIFSCFKTNVIKSVIKKNSQRKYEEELGEVLAEVTLFENDLKNELIFDVDGKAQLLNYYQKQVEVGVTEHENIYRLYLDNQDEFVDIHYDEEDKEYSAHDGAEGYGWYKTIKEAVKNYMDSEFRYPSDDVYDEISCSNCRDGGCFYCEPHRYL